MEQQQIDRPTMKNAKYNVSRGTSVRFFLERCAIVLLSTFIINTLMEACIYLLLFHVHPFFKYIYPYITICIVLNFLCFSIGILFWLDQFLAILLYHIEMWRKGRERAWQDKAHIPLLSYEGDIYEISRDSRENVVELQERLKQGGNLLLLGLPGGGKTVELRAYQRSILKLKYLFALAVGRVQIPVLILLKEYNAFLKSKENGHLMDDQQNSSTPPTEFFMYLCEDMRLLHPYLQHWRKRGRIQFLCDGLNELDRGYQRALCDELIVLTEQCSNRLVMTSRAIDYREQQDFNVLVDMGHARIATILPLSDEQQNVFIKTQIEKGYINKKRELWSRTAQEVIQFIDDRHLRSSECANPLMLLTLMQTINSIDTTKGINTRGQLLREFVTQLIKMRMEQPDWKGSHITGEEIIPYLGEIACTARRMKCRNALPLNITTPIAGKLTYLNQATRLDELVVNMEKIDPSEMAQYPEAVLLPFDQLKKRADLLKFAEDAGLISFSQHGHVLSFRHELIAEYFVAECLKELEEQINQAEIDPHIKLSSLPYGRELLVTEGDWNEPIRIWAGLLDNHLSLAERLGNVGWACLYNNEDYGYNALASGMMCLSVHWMQSSQDLPPSLYGLLNHFVSYEDKRERLASTFARCAQEGNITIYNPLMSVLTQNGTRELLMLLPQTDILKLLFEHLIKIAGIEGSEKEVLSLVSILSGFGRDVVSRALELSGPLLQGSLASIQQKRLRRAAISILGGTKDSRATIPLISYLNEHEEIVDEAVAALQKLGPDITLKTILEELRASSNTDVILRQRSILRVLEEFLATDLTPVQHDDIIKKLLQILSSQDLDIIQNTITMLIREAKPPAVYAQGVIEKLILELSSDHQSVQFLVQILARVGDGATNLLRRYLNKEDRSVSHATIRLRIVEVFEIRPAFAALPDLLELVAVADTALREKIASALCNYNVNDVAPYLVKKVLSGHPQSIALASNRILNKIGHKCVEFIAQHLLDDAPVNRIILLVETIKQMRDERAVPQLIALLRKQTQKESELAIQVIQALSEFSNNNVVQVIFVVFNYWPIDSDVYREASNALSRQTTELNDMLIVLNNNESSDMRVKGVLDAISQMRSFPDNMLLSALSQCSDVQAEYIKQLFLRRKAEEAPFLIEHLCHPDARIEKYVREIVHSMGAETIIDPLLSALPEATTEQRQVIIGYLRHYPDEAILPLVRQLSDEHLGRVASSTLIEFGYLVIDRLGILRSALNEQANDPWLLAQKVLVDIVQRQMVLLPQMLHFLRNLTLPFDLRAYDAILHILSNKLIPDSIHYLLQELNSEYPMVSRGAKDALILIGHRNDVYSENVVYQLAATLRSVATRAVAEDVLGEIREKQMIQIVYPLISDPDKEVAQIACRILSRAGAVALPLVHEDLNSSDPIRRALGEHILVHMDPNAIKATLIQLLANQDREKAEQGLVILLRRVYADEAKLDNQYKMIPVLLEYIQSQEHDRTTLPVLMFLLLQPDRRTLLDSLDVVLSQHSQPQQWLMPLFLLLAMEGSNAKTILARLIKRDDIPHPFHKELVGILSMLEANSIVVNLATSIGQYTQSSNRTYAKQLDLARHALGGLLVGEHWDAKKLQELKNGKLNGSIQHELFSILLGEPYAPRVEQLRKDLEHEKQRYQKALNDYQTKLSQLDQEKSLAQERLQEKEQAWEATQANLNALQARNNSLIQTHGRDTEEINRLKARNDRLANTLSIHRIQIPS